MHMIQGDDGDDPDLDETKHVDNGSRETRRRARFRIYSGKQYLGESSASLRYAREM